MSTEQHLLRDPRVTEAVNSLKTLIAEHYPTATFRTFQGEDPEGVYLRAAVDLDDPDAVLDLAIDRLLAYQLEQDLPVYLVPVRTDARIAAELAKRTATKRMQTSLPPAKPQTL